MAQDLIEAGVLTTPVHSDDRGYFAESWNTTWGLGIDMDIKQTNICWTERRMTLRGLHAQFGSSQVAKLVRVIKGEILDVYVDARQDSPDYGQWKAAKLNHVGSAIYIPRGFYHGYVTLTDDVLVTYHQDAVHDKNRECGLNFKEAGRLFWESWLINIDELHISEKDRNQPHWNNAVKF